MTANALIASCSRLIMSVVKNETYY